MFFRHTHHCGVTSVGGELIRNGPKEIHPIGTEKFASKHSAPKVVLYKEAPPYPSLFFLILCFLSLSPTLCVYTTYLLMSPVWNRLIRFVGADNKTYFGEPIISKAEETVDQLLANGSLEAKVITGDVLSDEAVVTDQVVKVQTLLAPLAREQIPIIKCVGLNYKAHSKQIRRMLCHRRIRAVIHDRC